jgi:erythromycin esterase-like protein
MPVPEAETGSWEDILHRASPEDKLLLMSDAEHIEELNTRQGHRAIGVVYKPEFERFGNYVPSVIPKRYDSFIFIDETKALHPLHIKPSRGKEPPETYPWGI